MSKADAESFIRQRKRNTRSTDDQVQTSHAMWDGNIDRDHDGLKRKKIEDSLSLSIDHRPKTVLHHLEEIGIVEEFVSGPPRLAIAEWMDNGNGEIVLGWVGEAAEQGLSALADEIESPKSGSEAATADGSGVTLRSVVASELDLIPERVEDYLRTTSSPVDVLNQAVDAIEETDGVGKSDDYGKIAFINTAYRYRLTQMAVDLYGR
jgi:hypothetical protein